MGLDGLVGGFFLFFLIFGTISIVAGLLFDTLKKKAQKASEEKKARDFQLQFGQNEEYKTKWRQNEKYNDILSNSISAIKTLAKEEEKRILYSDEREPPKNTFYIDFSNSVSNTLSCATQGQYDDSNVFHTVFLTDFKGYNISDEQRRALLRALKEDIEKEIPKLVFYFGRYPTLCISVQNYQNYIEKKDVF